MTSELLWPWELVGRVWMVGRGLGRVDITALIVGFRRDSGFKGVYLGVVIIWGVGEAIDKSKIIQLELLEWSSKEWTLGTYQGGLRRRKTRLGMCSDSKGQRSSKKEGTVSLLLGTGPWSAFLQAAQWSALFQGRKEESETVSPWG